MFPYSGTPLGWCGGCWTSRTSVRRLKQQCTTNNNNQDPHEAGRQAEGLEAVQTAHRKRNSVNPPLIRYNGSLVVCPVFCAHLPPSLRTPTVFAASQLCLNLPKTYIPKKDNRKCPINHPDEVDGEGETCVGSLLRRGHTTWPSAELTCSGRGRAAGCFVANFRPHTNSQTRAGHTRYKKDPPPPRPPSLTV